MNLIQYSFIPSLLLFFLIPCPPVWASVFNLPEKSYENLIGPAPETPFYTSANEEDTLLDVARRYNVGQNEIVLLNPEVDRWLPGTKSQIFIPKSRILPDSLRLFLLLSIP